MMGRAIIKDYGGPDALTTQTVEEEHSVLMAD